METLLQLLRDADDLLADTAQILESLPGEVMTEFDTKTANKIPQLRLRIDAELTKAGK